MKYYQVNIGTEQITIRERSLKDAKQRAQWIKFWYNYTGKTSVKLIGYITNIK